MARLIAEHRRVPLEVVTVIELQGADEPAARETLEIWHDGGQTLVLVA